MSEQYFRCGGCGRFVSYAHMEEHYNSKHEKGIATESPPSPSTVANPPPFPSLYGKPIPPSTPQPDTVSVMLDILLMRRSYKKAFLVWTLIVFAVTAMFISTLYTWLVFHI